MKAHILYGIGDLRFEETATPVPKENEALVRVMAAGICGSDIPRIYQTGAHVHPLIPGHEFSGQVADLVHHGLDPGTVALASKTVEYVWCVWHSKIIPHVGATIQDYRWPRNTAR